MENKAFVDYFPGVSENGFSISMLVYRRVSTLIVHVVYENQLTSPYQLKFPKPTWNSIDCLTKKKPLVSKNGLLKHVSHL